MGGRLTGRQVVIARAPEQAGRLRARLEAEGAVVIEIPTFAIADPMGGGEALRHALGGLWDWVVVTSPNGADRAVSAAGGRAAAHALAWAAVGPGTAETLARHGIRPALVPDRFVAEGLVDAFPTAPVDRIGRVLVAQAEAARPVLVEGLRSKGWEVTAVVAYRTVPTTPDAAALDAAAGADAIAFTSGSTVEGYLRSAGPAAVPPVVVAIGPVTAGVAERAGLSVAAVAEPHSLEGLVEATVAALA
ncbi:MAG TPA: uroporphyrinogen-III synthase [Acidimicrobiales bacterium]|nr:uroporphyrinogen-III synthase [Acidimicrobiales bacterium]